MQYDVIIIGGGPSGLTAALYTSRAGLKTFLIESYCIPSQAITADCIENYPGFPEGIGGFELIEGFKKQAKRFGVEFGAGEVAKIREYKKEGRRGWRVGYEDKSYTAPSLIIATGAVYKKLGVPGEDRLSGKGVSYCATCDGALYKDKDIVVIGGGNSAVEEALFLTRFGKSVTLIHRRDRLRAVKVLQERAFANKKIRFLWDSVVTEISGENKVRAVKVENVKTGKAESVPCDGVFIFVGNVPNTEFVKDLVRLDENGYVITDENMRTSTPGIFACGDCRRKILRQIVTACGDGAIAGFSSQHYVEEIKGIAYK